MIMTARPKSAARHLSCFRAANMGGSLKLRATIVMQGARADSQRRPMTLSIANAGAAERMDADDLLVRDSPVVTFSGRKAVSDSPERGRPSTARQLDSNLNFLKRTRISLLAIALLLSMAQAKKTDPLTEARQL